MPREYVKEVGQKVQAGQTVTLRRGDVERYLRSHPGLLRPVPMNTMAEVLAVRSEIAPEPVKGEPAEVQAESEAPAAASTKRVFCVKL